MTARADPAGTLYEAIANALAAAIEGGTLKAGDRLPSVRKISRQHGVSIATAVQAYRHLEIARLVEARPKSGFFVLPRRRPLPEPALSRPPASPRYVATPTLLNEYLDALENGSVAHIGAVLPHPEVYPSRRLAALMARQVRRNPELTTRYRISRGSEELRQAVARRMFEAGCRLSAADILVTDGCIEAITLCLRAVARPGDTIALESPTYFLFLYAIKSLGMQVLEIPTHPRTGISVEALDLATRRRGAVRAVLLVPTYSNPLGSVMPDESKAALVSLCAERAVAVIEDDIFGDTGFGPTRPLPAKAWDRTGNVLLCSSFTKTLAPGLRVGWVAPGRYMKEVEMHKIASTMFTPFAQQLAVAEFVVSGGYDHHLRRLRAALADRVRRFTDAVAETFPAGCRVTRPSGGYQIWVELPARVDAVEVFRRASREGVVVPPGPLFTTTSRFRNCLRMSHSQPWSRKTEAAVATVGRIARELVGKGHAPGEPAGAPAKAEVHRWLLSPGAARSSPPD